MTKTIICLFLSVIAFQPLVAEEHSAQESDIRTVSLSGSLGVLEQIGVGIAYQLNESYSVGGMIGGYWLNGDADMLPNCALGIGVRGSYYFHPTGEGNFLAANAVSCDIMYLLGPDPWDPDGLYHGFGGMGIDAVVGHDGIIGKGLGIYWGIGLSASFHQNIPPLLAPAFKLGVHIDV